MVEGLQVPAGIQVDVVPDDGPGRDDHGARYPRRGDGQVDPQQPAPAAARKAAVGEEQDAQPEQRDSRRPAGLEQYRHPAERQPPGPHPVTGERVSARVAAEDQETHRAQEQPAQGVARLAPGHHEAHHTEHRGQVDAATTQPEAQVAQATQRERGRHQGYYHPAQDRGGGGGGQPPPAGQGRGPGHGPPPVIQTETWDGSRARRSTSVRSARTVSRLTASCRRLANASTIWSAS